MTTGKILLAAAALLACTCMVSADVCDNGALAVNLDFERGEKGWWLPQAYSIARGAGMNGTSALVYDNADPKLPYAFPSQKIKLEPGQTYRFSAWIRTEGLGPANVHGATLGIEWSDANGRHLGGSYAGGLKGTTDWTRLEGVTTTIPEKAASFRFIPYCSPGCVGKAYFDDLEIAPYEKPVVGHLLSSAYRNTADKGRIEFRVGLAVPKKYSPEDLKAEFSYETPDGSRKTVPAQDLSRDMAVCSVDVSELKRGKSVVAFRLKAPDGSALGATKLSFNRVAKMPPRRVWIDEHRRTIVDGKPFFPLGMYTGSSSRREEYVKGPFNCVMPYQAPDAVGMDFYWTNGVRVIYSVKDVYAGAKHTPMSVTSEDAADSYVQAKVDAFKHHPGLLAWYVNDELVGDGWFGMLTRRRDFLERADPDHPTWAVIYQLQFLREMTPTFDVIGTDPYPVPDKPLSMATDWTRRTDRAYFGLRPVWQVPQAFDWGGYRTENPGSPQNRMPTVDEMRSMSWQCIASGANGLVYYSFTAIQKETHGLPFANAWADICKVGEEVRRYIPVLLSVEPAPTVTGAPAAWGVRTWRKDGTTWLLVVNAQDKSDAAELTLSEEFSDVAAEFGPAAEKTGARTAKISLAPNEPALYRIKSWEPPRTTRRYVHPPMAERMCVLFNDAKLMFSEVRHEHNWTARYYSREVGNVLWFFHGKDDRLFDFKKAENFLPDDGVPLHGLRWRENDVAVTLETCCDFVRRTTAHGRFSVVNGSAKRFAEEYAIRVRYGNEATLLGGYKKQPPDYYAPYVSLPETWSQVVCDWTWDGGVLRSPAGGFITFSKPPPSARWDAKLGELRFSVDLKDGESFVIDFAVGIGADVQPAFETTRRATADAWQRELAKINRLPKGLMDNPEHLRIVKNMVVQMLQCFCHPVGCDYVLPRQGGLQRWVWPWDNMDALSALGKVGDFGEYVESAIDFYFGLYGYGSGGYREPENSGRIGPFGNDWDCNTANCLGILARYCLDTGCRAPWDRYRAKALEGFRWIMRSRVPPGAADAVPGFFPAGLTCDYKTKTQSWGFTDALNLIDMGDYLAAAERFGDPALAEIRAGFEDYLGAMRERVLLFKQESADKEDFDIPISPDRQEVEKGFPRLYHGNMVVLGLKNGYLDANDVLRVWKWCLRNGQASANGLTGKFSTVSDDPVMKHYWYTTSQDYLWHRAFRRIGYHDQADTILAATLKFAMTRELYVGERYRDDEPWFLPWSPNCSGSGRIVQMLLERYGEKL